MYTAHSTLRPPEPTAFGTFRRSTSVLFGLYTASIRVGGFTYTPAPTHSREPSLEMRGCVAYRNVRVGDALPPLLSVLFSLSIFLLPRLFSPFLPPLYLYLARFEFFLCPSSRASYFFLSFFLTLCLVPMVSREGKLYFPSIGIGHTKQSASGVLMTLTFVRRRR